MSESFWDGTNGGRWRWCCSDLARGSELLPLPLSSVPERFTRCDLQRACSFGASRDVMTLQSAIDRMKAVIEAREAIHLSVHGSLRHRWDAMLHPLFCNRYFTLETGFLLMRGAGE
jgi:hypothetical protein